MTNTADVGRFVYGKNEAAEPQREFKPLGERKRKKSSRKALPPEQWVTIPCQPIIAEETFQRTQGQLTANAQFSPRHNTRNEYLLRGLIRCGKCGGAYVGKVVRCRNGGGQRYYYCRSADPYNTGPQGPCRGGYLNADASERTVWETVLDLLKPDALAEEYRRRVAEGEQGGDTAEATKAQADLKGIERQERRWQDAYAAEASDLATLKERTAACKVQRQALEGRLAALGDAATRRQQQTQALASLQEFCRQVGEGLENADFAGRQKVLRLMVERVVVDGGGLRIELAIPLGGAVAAQAATSTCTHCVLAPFSPTSATRSPSRTDQTDVAQRRLGALWVAEGHSVQGDLAETRPGRRRRACRFLRPQVEVDAEAGEVEYLVADILAQRACDLTHRRLHGLQRQERSRELSRLQVPAEQAPGREAEAPRQPDRGQAERCLVPPNARKDTNRPRRRGARSEPIPNGGPRTLLRGSWRAHLRGRVTWARPRAAFPRCGVCTPADRRADDHRCPSTGGFLPPDDRRAGPGGAAGAGTGIWGTGPWRSVVQGQRRSGGHGRGGQHGRLAAGAPTGASPPATYRVEGGVPVGDQAVSGGSEPQGAQPSVPAFAALVEPHLTPVSRMLRGLLPTSQDAEDVLQDTLLHAYVGMAGLRRMDVFGPWLRTIAYNRAMQWQRRRYAERHAGPLPWHLGQVPGPEAQVELHADVTTALGLLSAADRDAVILRYAQGFTSAEVGRLQGEIASTVRWRLRRALGVLRTALAAAEPAPMEANRDGGRDGIDGRRDDPGAARRT